MVVLDAVPVGREVDHVLDSLHAVVLADQAVGDCRLLKICRCGAYSFVLVAIVLMTIVLMAFVLMTFVLMTFVEMTICLEAMEQPALKMYHCFNTNIYSYSETSGCQKSNLYLNIFHFFNTGVN